MRITALIILVALTHACAGPGGSGTASAGYTSCGTFGDQEITCQPGQYCADQVLNTCSVGCLSNANCASGQVCDLAAATPGTCKNTGTAAPAPTSSCTGECLRCEAACDTASGCQLLSPSETAGCKNACNTYDQALVKGFSDCVAAAGAGCPANLAECLPSGFTTAPPAPRAPRNPVNPGATTFDCCINGTHYSCGSQAALDQCIGFDVNACIEKCSFTDSTCMDACFDALDASNPNPSACTLDPSKGCQTTPVALAPVGCGAAPKGVLCDVDSDCTSFNCVGGSCYGNSAGNPCDVDSDCATFNCTSGCCYGNGAGNPCDVDSDCGSFNCAQGLCQ